MEAVGFERVGKNYLKGANMKKAACKLFGHKYFNFLSFSRFTRLLMCARCGTCFLMNDTHKALFEWDSDCDTLAKDAWELGI